MKVLLQELRPYLESVKKDIRVVICNQEESISTVKSKRKSRAKKSQVPKGVCTCSENHHVKPITPYSLKFQFFWCSDWKMLATVLGLNAANSDYFCPFCTWLAQAKTLSKPEDFKKYLRSFTERSGKCCLLCDDNCAFSATTPALLNSNLTRRTCKPVHGIVEPMLLPLSVFDSINCIWIDVLHCLLRLTDVQERALIQATTWREEPLEALITAVKTQCSVNWIPFEKYDKTTGGSYVKFPTLDGKVRFLTLFFIIIYIYQFYHFY